MIMFVQRYTIQVSYKPGKELLVADSLSKSPLLADDLEYQEYDINILHTLPITKAKLEEFKQSTKADLALTDGQKRNQMFQLELNPFGTTAMRSPTTTAFFSKEVESLYLPPCAQPC